MSNTEWGVWCIRSAGSRFNQTSSWLRDNSPGGVYRGSEEQARRLAEKISTESTSPNVRYEARPFRED